MLWPHWTALRSPRASSCHWMVSGCSLCWEHSVAPSPLLPCLNMDVVCFEKCSPTSVALTQFRYPCYVLLYFFLLELFESPHFSPCPGYVHFLTASSHIITHFSTHRGFRKDTDHDPNVMYCLAEIRYPVNIWWMLINETLSLAHKHFQQSDHIFFFSLFSVKHVS